MKPARQVSRGSALSRPYSGSFPLAHERLGYRHDKRSRQVANFHAGRTEFAAALENMSVVGAIVASASVCGLTLWATKIRGGP
jgi:hypothetical protein